MSPDGDRNSGSGAERPRRPGAFAPGNPSTSFGARNRATLAALSLREGEADAFNRRCVKLALAGDPAALRLCVERLLPKGRAVRLDLPLRHW